MTDTILHQLHLIAQANGLTAAAWARVAGMPKQNLNAMLMGHREPRETTLIRLAEAAGATITIKNSNSMRHQSSSKAVATVQQIDENDQPVGQPFQVEVNADKAANGSFDFFDVLTQCQQQTGVLALTVLDTTEA